MNASTIVAENTRFLNEDFMLETREASELYHEHAADLPVIDYHNHLSPADIANDICFENLTKLWLQGDHYKWRAMRANGIAEDLITGAAGDEEKFMAWAATVPCTMRNPLYHWTHMELQRYFGINELLDEQSGPGIYRYCNELLATRDFSVKNLLRRMKVKVLCTTDDPCDGLEHHLRLRDEGCDILVLPSFRPDAAIAAENPVKWGQYLQRLSSVSGTEIRTYEQFMDALRSRHDFFSEAGCCVSDHGCEVMYGADFTRTAVRRIFEKLLSGKPVDTRELLQFKSAVLYELAVLDHEKQWVQQWHVGAIRNTNTRLGGLLGADAGADSIGDFSGARFMVAFFDRLDAACQLSRTIIYNLNPADNEVFAAMAGNYQDGSIPGKIQYGAAWWFLDQKEGIERQLNALSNLGLLSRFVGMLTDSRSFLSFPRHEYFRRILCNMIGTDIAKGLLPDDRERIAGMIKDICYNNAVNYFRFPLTA